VLYFLNAVLLREISQPKYMGRLLTAGQERFKVWFWFGSGRLTILWLFLKGINGRNIVFNGNQAQRG
jgi:hypothetical protein